MCKICANYLLIDKNEDHLNDRQETMPYHTANELNKKRGEPNERNRGRIEKYENVAKRG